MDIQNYEIKMWEAAKNRDAEAFLQLVSADAEMVCGGYRCSGAEYAEIIKDFDLAEYEISDFEIVDDSNDTCQVRYIITTKVSDERNADLEGRFLVNSTWKRFEDGWRLMSNSDKRL